jgi:predicted CopG family antitoxin
MTTTVQVSDEMRERLEELKVSWGLKTFDEVIRRMVRLQTDRPESFFGVARGSKPFVRDQEEDHEVLRD